MGVEKPASTVPVSSRGRAVVVSPAGRVTTDEDGVLGGDAAEVPVFQVFLEDVAAAQEQRPAVARVGRHQIGQQRAAVGDGSGWRIDRSGVGIAAGYVVDVNHRVAGAGRHANVTIGIGGHRQHTPVLE